MADMLFKEQIDFILNLGEGVKACLFDFETKDYISNLISFSKFQEHDFFYFSYITNKYRISLNDIFCIVIIKPSNLKNLVEELSNPCYGKYIILFTNQIDPFVLEIIAKADAKCVVDKIYEIYLDVAKESNFLYLTNSTKYKNVLDGLSSIIFSLKINPCIKHIQEIETRKSNKLESNSDETIIVNDKTNVNKPKHNSNTRDINSTINFVNLKNDLVNRAKQYNFTKEGNILFLKRNFDLFTPLVYDWHYQALINHHLEFKNNVVKINNKDFFLNDKFFEKNKFCNIHYIGDEIKKELKELKKNKIKISNHEFEDIEEKAAHSMIVDTHLNIYDALIKDCMQNKNFSEDVMTLIRDTKLSNTSVTFENIEALVEKYDEEQQLVLYLLFFLKKGKNWEEESKKVGKFNDILLEFKEKYEPINYPYKPTFYDNRDIKLAYEPPLKKLIKHILLNKVRAGMFQEMGKEFCDSNILIIYIEGGITMTEYREAMIQANELNCVLYLISDCILDRKNIIQDINLLSIFKKKI